ncbi:MAG: TIGR04283 family arsenosugar biosynthesis glycosyltransferase, partial [Cyanobacteria bacterium J06639_1]
PFRHGDRSENVWDARVTLATIGQCSQLGGKLGGGSQMKAEIAIVIPTWQESGTVLACLQQFERQALPFEVIVSDGGSPDGTEAIALNYLKSCPYSLDVAVSPERGRAAQMNWGATQTTADILLFLHADSRLPVDGLQAIRDVLADAEAIGGRFQVRLDATEWPYSAISWGINARSRLTGLFTGDMGIFIRRSVLEQLGGFPAQVLLEDLEMSKRMQRAGRVAFLSSEMTTSSRRWQQGGAWRTVALMQCIRYGYHLGIAPERLAEWYATVR